MSLLERFPAYKVISSVIQNPLGPFKTRGGEGGKGKEKSYPLSRRLDGL